MVDSFKSEYIVLLIICNLFLAVAYYI